MAVTRKRFSAAGVTELSVADEILLGMGYSEDPRAERARELRRADRTLAQIKAELGLRSNSQLWGWVRGIPAPAWSKRPRAKDAERKRARELRALGWTYRAIAAELGVAKASVSSWLQDPEARRSSEPWAVRRRRVAIERQTEKFEAARSVGLLTDRELLLVGATAYWAEGSKAKPWSPYQSLTFVNSDPDMIRLFLRWLHLLGVDPRHIRLTVQIHDSANIGEAERFWAGVVAVPDAVFRKPLSNITSPRQTARTRVVATTAAFGSMYAARRSCIAEPRDCGTAWSTAVIPDAAGRLIAWR